jgi:CheY-like chemotaxis protein
MMLEMDGFEVVAALHKQDAWRDIPVIVITSLDLDAKKIARTLKRTEGATRQKAFSLGVSLDSRA